MSERPWWQVFGKGDFGVLCLLVIFPLALGWGVAFDRGLPLLLRAVVPPVACLAVLKIGWPLWKRNWRS